jgi:hypothetical protein
MIKRGTIVTSTALILTVLFVVGSYQKNKRVDKIGQTLANWSSAHQTTIRINGKQISFMGSPIIVTGIDWCRTEVPVCWQTVEATAEDNQTVRKNLKNIIDESDCDLQTLLTYTGKLNDIENLKQLEAGTLAQDLRCLGNFEFMSFGSK